MAGAGRATGRLTGEPATGEFAGDGARVRRSARPEASTRRIAKLALGAGAAGVVVAATVVGVQQASSSPAAELGQGGAGNVRAPTAAEAAAAEVSAATASDAAAPGGGWRATPVTDEGRSLGDFAVAAEPSREHPAGVIAALAFAASAGAATAVTVAGIDVESGRVFTHNLVGYLTDQSTIRIARTHRGVVVGHQRKGNLQLQWYTDGAIDADTRTVRQLGARKDQALRAFSVFDDRIVVATGGAGVTTVAILDEKGKLLTSHVCHGGIFSPGDAELVQVGDDVLVTNLTAPVPEHMPICAGGLHGSPRWRDVVLRDGQLRCTRAGSISRGTAGPTSPGSARWTRTSSPPGSLRRRRRIPPRARRARGSRGTIVRRSAEIAGLDVVSMEACCGDEGGGLFVCRPPPKEGR